MCWEQIEPSPEVSQLNYNDWKQLGLLPQEIYNAIIPMFSKPSLGPPLAWPGTDWDWIPQSCWFAPNGTYWLCGSNLWVWLPPGWIGRCTLGLTFIHSFLFSELPEKPINLPHFKTPWAISVFHWYDHLATIFVLSGNYRSDVILQVDALTNFQPLMLNKYKLKRWFYKTDWP